VTCRLGHVHRATGDVDAVADELATVGTEGSSAQALVDRGIARADPGGREHRVFVDGTKLEIIDTQALTDDVDDIESAPDRLFLLGHRWALDSAEPLRITVAGTDIDVTLPSPHPLHWSQPNSTRSAIVRATRSERPTPTTSFGSSRATTETAVSQMLSTKVHAALPKWCTNSPPSDSSKAPSASSDT
jgi:hypothetical protein